MKKPLYFFALLVLLTSIFSSATQAQERRGWSPQAKGAVIGAGSGAILGAVINRRNRAVGGVVGGVVGAGAGYAIGKHRDNKNKERARIAEANRLAAYRAEQEAHRQSLARQASANRPQSALVASSLVPAAPAASPAALSAPAAPTINTAFLPNNAASNPANPYAASEYRRKSW